MRLKSKAADARAAGWSLTRRLALLYTVSAALILLLASQFWYLSLVDSLEREDVDFLADRIMTVRKLLQNPAHDVLLQQQIALEGVSSYVIEPHYTRLLREGHIVLESPGMPAILPPSLFPVPASITAVPKGVKQWRSPAGRAYMLMAAEAQSVGSTAPMLIQVALDMTDEGAIVASYRMRLVVGLLLGVLAAAGAGTAITRRGLKPILDIADAATQISATHLHRRIGRAGRPDELVDLAAAFDRMLDRLEESFTRLSNFSADLAHELRTPINNLVGEAEVALERVREPEDYRRVLESSLEEYARLSRTIDSLLFLARADNEEVPIDRKRFDARSEIAPVMEFYEPMAVDAGITMRCEGDAYLNADAILFRRALSNLLSNALRHTPSGGRVVVRATVAAGGWAEIAVADTGIGIAPEHLPRIFDRFYRADPARSTSPGNVGLGLALVKSIMELHGGTSHITSVLGEGTRAVLRFPGSARTRDIRGSVSEVAVA